MSTEQEAIDALDALTAPLDAIRAAMEGLGPDSTEDTVAAALLKMEQALGQVERAGADAVAKIKAVDE